MMVLVAIDVMLLTEIKFRKVQFLNKCFYTIKYYNTFFMCSVL